MTILRFLNPQGIAGIVVTLCLTILLVIQMGETSHWKKQSGQFEQLYRGEQTAFAETVSNYRAAAAAARAADQASKQRVLAEQRSINERTEHDFETRLAAARVAAGRLRVDSESAANPGARGTTSLSAISPSSLGADQAADENRLPSADALTATEQAIQLDELIKWVKEQAKVDNNAPAVASQEGD